MTVKSQRLIVGISGASGAIYGVRLLAALRDTPIETHLIMSKSAELTRQLETNYSREDVHALADHVHNNQDMSAAIASGSFKTLGMVIAPCSMRSLAEIATGCTTTLLSRAADVILKERRRLVLLVRETPLNNVHLRNMLTISEMGGIIAPPVPAFYAQPASLDQLVDHTVGRCLDLFDIENNLVTRWREQEYTR